MFLDINGPDFIRVQTGANVRQGDVLHPDVVFSGNFDDGSCMFFQGSLNNSSLQFNFPYELACPPLIFGILCLTQTLSQGGMVFNAGEYITPALYRKQPYAQNPTINYSFAFGASKTQLFCATIGFVGVASFMVVDM